MATAKYTREWVEELVNGLKGDEGERKIAEEKLFSEPYPNTFIKLRVDRFWDVYGILETEELYTGSYAEKTRSRMEAYAKRAMVAFFREHFSWEHMPEVQEGTFGVAAIKASNQWVSADIRKAVRETFNEVYGLSLTKEDFLTLVAPRRAGKYGYFNDYSAEEISEATQELPKSSRKSPAQINRLQYKLRDIFPGVASKALNRAYEYDTYIEYPETVRTFYERAAFSWAIHHPDAVGADVSRYAKEFRVSDSIMMKYMKTSRKQVKSARATEYKELVDKAEMDGLIKPDDKDLILQILSGKRCSDYANERGLKKNSVSKKVQRFRAKAMEKYGCFSATI